MLSSVDIKTIKFKARNLPAKSRTQMEITPQSTTVNPVGGGGGGGGLIGVIEMCNVV